MELKRLFLENASLDDYNCLHAFQAVFLLVVLSRDAAKQAGFEQEKYKPGTVGPPELSESVMLYSQNTTYYVRG